MAHEHEQEQQNNPAGNTVPPEGKQAGNPGDIGSDPREKAGSREHGVFPASGQNAPDDAQAQGMASFGQGKRGAEGYQDHGESELDKQDLEPRDVTEQSKQDRGQKRS